MISTTFRDVSTIKPFHKVPTQTLCCRPIRSSLYYPESASLHHWSQITIDHKSATDFARCSFITKSPLHHCLHKHSNTHTHTHNIKPNSTNPHIYDAIFFLSLSFLTRGP